MHVFDGSDRKVLSEEELEGFPSGGHRNLAFDEAHRGRAAVFVLGPGDGLHLPVTFPHYVENGDAVSLSLSITFQTPSSERRAAVYKVNAWLRRRGASPRSRRDVHGCPIRSSTAATRPPACWPGR